MPGKKIPLKKESQSITLKNPINWIKRSTHLKKSSYSSSPDHCKCRTDILQLLFIGQTLNAQKYYP
jgi:hypothetical protein